MRAINRLRIYLETTVFNYYYDEDREGHDDVVRLFEAIGRGEYEAYTSEYVSDELILAPEPKRSNMLSLIDRYGIGYLWYAPDAVRLSGIYLNTGIIPKSHVYDSLHVAIASVHRLDCIVSYNFQHINRTKTQIFTTNVNNAEGYGGITICTAKEVLNNES